MIVLTLIIILSLLIPVNSEQFLDQPEFPEISENTQENADQTLNVVNSDTWNDLLT